MFVILTNKTKQYTCDAMLQVQPAKTTWNSHREMDIPLTKPKTNTIQYFLTVFKKRSIVIGI